MENNLKNLIKKTKRFIFFSPITHAIIQFIYLIPILLFRYPDSLIFRLQLIILNSKDKKSRVHKDTVILFHCHFLNERILKEFKKIIGSCCRNHDIVLLYDNTKRDFKLNEKINFYLFDSTTAQKLRYSESRIKIEPKWYNSEFAVLDFFLKNPSYKYYWRVEHDVSFSGIWSRFFDFFKENSADFISTYIRGYNEDKSWYWWDAINLKLDNNQKVVSFFPIERFSNRALKLLDNKYKSGISGFCEVVVPTLLNLEGYKLQDIGRKWYDKSTFLYKHKPLKKIYKLSHPVI
jgi:hypothetical protein